MRGAAIMEINFNSTLVRLKDHDCGRTLLGWSYFNSTLVRLKEPQTWFAISSLSAFQFHIGAIKRAYGETVPGIYGNFNSTLVRLKAYKRNSHLLPPIISIPHWCD